MIKPEGREFAEVKQAYADASRKRKGASRQTRTSAGCFAHEVSNCLSCDAEYAQDTVNQEKESQLRKKELQCRKTPEFSQDSSRATKYPIHAKRTAKKDLESLVPKKVPLNKRGGEGRGRKNLTN